MSNDHPHPEKEHLAPDESRHIEAVLEPVTPSSRYAFVDIAQDPIAMRSPIGGLLSIAPKSLRALRWVLRDQWKMLLVVLALVIVAELAARSFEPRLTGRVYNQALTGGHPQAINEQGFRGSPVPSPKPEGTYRVLALGDSVTFGTGIHADDTWPAQLGAMLNDSGNRTDVINAGLPALDLGQLELELRTHWAQHEPDEIVLAMTGNMVSFAYARRQREQPSLPGPKARAQTPETTPGSWKEKAKGVYARFALPGAFTMGMEQLKFAIGTESHRYNPDFPVGVMLAHGYEQANTDPQLPDRAYEIVHDQLATLALTAQGMGCTLSVVYAPPRFSISERTLDNLKHVDRDRLRIDPSQRLGAICDELGIRFIDPSAAIADAPAPAYVLFDYTHFDRSGHEAIARMIAERISLP